MSLIEVLLARKEVLISLVVVGLILLSAVSLAVGPGIYRRWKKMSAHRKAERAARLAEAKRAEAKKKRGRARTATPAPVEAVGEAEADEEEAGEEDEAGDETPAAAEQPDGTTTAAPVAAAAAQPEPPAEAATETPTEEAEKSSENVVASAMQDILDSVFVDEEVTGRYDVLLQGIEVGSAEELLDMATRIAAELGTKRANRSKSGDRS